MPSKNYARVVALILALQAGSAGAGTGRNSAAFLQITADPRSAVMGDSIAYAPDSPAVMLSNPAALTSIYQAKISLTNMPLGAGIDYGFAGIVLPRRSLNVGFGASYLSYGSIQSYDATGASLGSVSPKDMALVLSGAVPLRHDHPMVEEYASVGANLKFIQSTLAGHSARALTADVGALFRIPGSERFSGSFAVKNIGGSLRYVHQDDALPTMAALGAKYSRPSWRNLVVTADLSQTFEDGILGLGAGVSCTPVYPVTVRAGWKHAVDNNYAGMRAGLGFDFNDFSIHYGLISAKEFSIVHQLGLDLAFGAIVRPDVAYNHYLTYHFEIARDKYRRKDYLAARQELEEILSLYPDHGPSKEYLIKIGQALDEIDKQRMVGISRWLSRARTAIERNNLLRARRYYKYVIGVDPSNEEAMEGLAAIDTQVIWLRRQQELRDKKEEIDRLWNESVAYYRSGNYVEAKNGFNKYLELNPSNQEAGRYLGQINAQLQQITTLQTNDLFAKGVELFEQGNYRDAVRYFNAVAIALPSRMDAQQYLERSNAILAAQDVKETQAQQDQGREQAREKAVAQIHADFDRAVILYRGGDYDEALKTFTEIRDAAVRQPRMEKVVTAAKNYLTLIREQYAEKEYKAGLARESAGDIEGAIGSFRAALNYNPAHAAARMDTDRVADVLAQQYYEKGMKAYTAGDAETAKSSFKKSLSFKPDKAESLRALERIK